MFSKTIQNEKKVPANIQYLGELRDFITEMGQKHGLSEREINAFKLAIDEAGTNIIRHAYRDWEGFITIRMVIREKVVTVSLIDQGHSFDLRKVDDPDLQRYVDIGKKGGLGIFIIRRVIDKIDYVKTEEGNVLHLTKYRDRRKFSIGMPDVGLSMRTKISAIAASVITVGIVSLFLQDYVRSGSEIRDEYFDVGKTVSRFVARQSGERLYLEETLDLGVIVRNVCQDHREVLFDALIVDSADVVQATTQENEELLFLETLEWPNPLKTVAQGVQETVWRRNYPVYVIGEPVYYSVSNQNKQIGTAYVLLNKSYINGQVTAKRVRYTFFYTFLFISGLAFVFFIIKFTMTPFRQLAKWVRALGQGEVQDAMDFSADDEIGEIAHAFNDITKKFRKSQENLAEQERLQKEMQVAKEIQQTLLPSEFPEIEGFEIASYYEAAKEVGGDYFDFVEVDNDTLGVVVADVSGKGVPGSLVMTMIRTALRTEARGNKNAADVLARVNDFVMNDMKRGMFVTIFYLILDSKNRTLNYASAGHNPMILYRGQTRKSYYLNPRGFPIGINLPDKALFRSSIESDTLQLREGDVLIAYTDGVTEAMNPRRDRYGDERFLSIIRRFGTKKVKPLVDSIREEITTFTEGFAQSDDITLVAICEKLRSEDVLFNMRSKLIRLVDKEGLSVKEACEQVGVSTSTYYKYRKRFRELGDAGLKERVERSSVEERHISIEDKAKIYDIIKQYPEYGAKRISEELNQEKYGFTLIDEKRIYDELVRSRLNKKELRQNFVERGGRGKRMKPPGTPFLSLDGKVVIDTGVSAKRPQEFSAGKAYPEFGEKYDKGRKSPYPDKTVRREDQPGHLGPERINLNVDEDRNIPIPEMDDERANILGIQDEELPEESTMSELIDINEEGEADNDDVAFLRAVQAHLNPEPEPEPEEKDIHPFEALVDELFEDPMQKSGVMIDDSNIAEILERAESDTSILDDEVVTRSSSGSVVDDLFEEELMLSDSGMSSAAKHFKDLKSGPQFRSKSGTKSTASQMAMQINRQRYLESGQWFYRQELYAKAIEEFEKAIETDSTYLEAYQSLGDAYFRLGQLQKAREAYERVRKMNPANIDVLENLGVIHANCGDYKKAVLQWGEVLKHSPERTDIIERIKRMQRVIRQRSA